MTSQEISNKQVDSPANPGGFGFRYVKMLMLFFAIGISYAVRVTTSVGIVAMTSENDYGFPVYDWNRATQDTILSSFFWGYVIPQIPAGVIAGKFGGKILLLISLLCNGLLNLALPFAAEYGWTAVCACRVIMGFTQGCVFPSTHALLSNWCPLQERGRMGTFVYAGAQFGTVCQMVIAGLLSASRWGWPSIYYSVGVVALVWVVLWIILGANSPAESRFVSDNEKKYFEAIMPSKAKGSVGPIPWKKFATSLPVYSIVVAHTGHAFGFLVLLTEMPSYMSKALGVDIKSNGVFSALPYVCMFLLSLVFSAMTDTISNRKWLTVTTIRKIFITIAFSGPALMLLALSYLPTGNIALAVTLLTLTVGLNGAHYVGFMMVHIDLSPNYASILMGITNCCSNIISIIAPLSVSLVVKDETDAAEWRKVFFIAIASYILANVFFILFASSERQPWNEPETEAERKKSSELKSEKSATETATGISASKDC